MDNPTSSETERPIEMLPGCGVSSLPSDEVSAQAIHGELEAEQDSDTEVNHENEVLVETLPLMRGHMVDVATAVSHLILGGTHGETATVSPPGNQEVTFSDSERPTVVNKSKCVDKQTQLTDKKKQLRVVTQKRDAK